MTVLRKQDIPRPKLAKETVPVPALGGDVVVQSLMLRDRFAWMSTKGPRFSHISGLLALCVLDCEGTPLFTADEWEAWGAQNENEAFELFKVCERLCGLDTPSPAETAEKNEPALS